jgi:23S rRNA (adenine2503-C2)-methyltransferase
VINLAGLYCKEIEEILYPLPGYRAKQIYKWIIRGADNFDKMTDLPNSLRLELSQRFSVLSSKIDSVHDDKDTKKIVIALNDGAKIEAVVLNDGKDRLTACLSTQVGCPAGCVFCKTGTLGFLRNLNASEIVEQYLHIGKVNNIVIMGMGEPLLNLEQLRKAVCFFTDPKGMNFSRKRITVSTCGIYEGIYNLAQHGPYIRLALSLTTADENLRQKLMPVTKTQPLSKIKEALILFQKNSGNRITLEIPLLGGVNTRKEDVLSIAEFAKGLECVVNIIPWNPVIGLELEGKPLIEPGKNETAEFIKLLEQNKLKVTTRYKKGRGVSGACGQLGVVPAAV